MNCQEIKELITSAIDGRLTDDVRPQFEAHLRQCPGCKMEFSLEEATKLFVRRNVKPVAASAALRSQILASISQETKGRGFTLTSLTSLFNFPTWQTAVAVGALALALIFLIVPGGKHHPPVMPDDDNMVHRTINYFHTALDGNFKPDLAGDNQDDVRAYFVKNANFNVDIPSMPSSNLLGVAYSRYTHEGIAQLVYRHGEGTIYLFQIRLQDLADSDGLRIPPEIMANVEHSVWRVVDQTECCCLAMCIKDSTLCCVASDLPPKNLLAYLSERK